MGKAVVLKLSCCRSTGTTTDTALFHQSDIHFVGFPNLAGEPLLPEQCFSNFFHLQTRVMLAGPLSAALLDRERHFPHND